MEFPKRMYVQFLGGLCNIDGVIVLKCHSLLHNNVVIFFLPED